MMRPSWLTPSMLRIGLLILWTCGLVAIADPGTFNIDEIHYLLAAQRFAEAWSFAVPNGFDLFRHDLLLFMHPQPLDALPDQVAMTTFIPPLYTFPAAFAYSIAGIAGLYALNTFAFIGCVLLAMRLAKSISGPEHCEAAQWIVLAAFLGGSFFSGYAIAIVNHALTLALVLGAIALHPVFRRAGESGQREILLTILSGLLIGCAFGVRLQQIVVIAVLLPFCFAISRRPVSHVAVFVLGLVPPIALTAWINHLRFDSWNPLSYGVASQARLIPLLGEVASNSVALLVLMVTALAVLGVAAWQHDRITKLIVAKARTFSPSTLIILASCGPVLLLLLPPFGGHFAERVVGLFPIPDPETDWRESPFSIGAIWSGVRTPLLASAPLVLAGLFAPLLLPTLRHSPRLWMLWAVAWANVLFVCLLSNNGGYFMNQRYLFEGAACALILASALCAPVMARVPRNAWIGGCAVVIVAAFMLLFLGTPGRNFGSPSTSLDLMLGRLIPVLAAVLVVAAFMLDRMAKSAGIVLLGVAIPYCFTIPIVHHGWYDIAHEHEYRRTRREAWQALVPHVPDGSLLIVYGGQREPAGRLKEKTDVWVADALRTDWEGVRELIEATHRNKWRERVFMVPASMPDELRDWLRSGMRTRVIVAEPVPLIEILPREDGVGAASADPQSTTSDPTSPALAE